MKFLTFFLCVLFMSGCASVEMAGDGRTPPELVDYSAPIMKKSLSNIGKIKKGMSYQEMMAVMGKTAKVGYSQGDGDDSSYKAMPIKNPYKVEMLEKDEKMLSVVYFFTAINKADGIVADDELTPVVLEDNKVIVKGWDDFYRLKSD